MFEITFQTQAAMKGKRRKIFDTFYLFLPPARATYVFHEFYVMMSRLIDFSIGLDMFFLLLGLSKLLCKYHVLCSFFFFSKNFLFLDIFLVFLSTSFYFPADFRHQKMKFFLDSKKEEKMG